MTDDPVAQFDAALAGSRERSIAHLREVADHRRVEILARQIHASLQGETQADATLALCLALGVGMRDMPLAQQVTGIAIVAHLVAKAILRDDLTADA